MDVLAWDDSPYAVAQVTGFDRRTVGKAWFAAAKRSSERPAENAHAQRLLCHDADTRPGHASLSRHARRAGDVSLWVPQIPRLLARAGVERPVRCDRADRRSASGAAGGVRGELLEETQLAAGFLSRVDDVTVRIDADFLMHSANAADLRNVPDFSERLAV